MVVDKWIVFNDETTHLAPDKLHIPCLKTGLECLNSEQPRDLICHDYNIRFFCAVEGMLKWVNRKETSR